MDYIKLIIIVVQILVIGHVFGQIKTQELQQDSKTKQSGVYWEFLFQ